MTCPICQRESDPKYRPFCSRRCSDVDLGRWLTGGYAIPAEPADGQDNPADETGSPGADPGRPALRQ